MLGSLVGVAHRWGDKNGGLAGVTRTGAGHGPHFGAPAGRVVA